MIDEEICVDHIARFENLTSEMKHIFDRIGLPFDGWFPWNKNNIRPKEANPKKMYSMENIKKMENIFGIEISLFNYKPNI